MLLRLPQDATVAILRHVDAIGLARIASTCQVLFYGKHNAVVHTLRLRGIEGPPRLPRLVSSWAVHLAWIACRQVDAWQPVAAADDTFVVVTNDCRLICVEAHSNAPTVRVIRPISTTLTFICVTAGRGFSAAVCATGNVYTWGNGGRVGCLGRGDRMNESLAPVHVHIPGYRIRSVSASQHCLAVTDTGEVMSWGSAADGKCGHGWSWATSTSLPRKIESLTGHRVRNASAGAGHSLVVTEEGVVFAFGRGNYGQLGHGNYEDKHTPTRVDALRSVRVKAIAAGETDSLALATEGVVFEWGGTGTGETTVSNPHLIAAFNGLNVQSIETSRGKRCAITATGQLFYWGSRQPVPICNVALSREHIIKASLGGELNVAITEDGRVFQWGEDATYTGIRCRLPHRDH